MKINENRLAVAIARKEGGKTQVNIAQIKQVLKITLQILSKQKGSEVLALVEKHR